MLGAENQRASHRLMPQRWRGTSLVLLFICVPLMLLGILSVSNLTRKDLGCITLTVDPRLMDTGATSSVNATGLLNALTNRVLENAVAGNGSAIEASTLVPVYPSTYGGVHHFALPGFVNTTTGKGTIPGQLHVFVKALTLEDERTILKGFVWFEKVEMPPARNPKTGKMALAVRTAPETFTSIRLRLRPWRNIRDGARPEAAKEQGPVYDLSLSFFPCPVGDFVNGKGQRECIPATSTTKKPKASELRFPEFRVDLGVRPSSTWTLEVAGWQRGIDLGWVLRTAERAVSRGGPPGTVRPIVQVFKPMATRDPITPALLARLVEYQQLIGVTGAVLYSRDELLDDFASSPDLAPHAAAGLFTLVRWSELSALPSWSLYDQEVLNNHAVLSAWGKNALVFTGDIDEVLALPTRGVTLQDMLAPGGCLSPEFQCGLVHASVAYSYEHGKKSPEGHDGRSFVAARTAKFSMSIFKFAEPVGRWRKPLVDPDAVVGYAVHDAAQCLGKTMRLNGKGGLIKSPCQVQRPCADVPTDCLIIKHLTNLHVQRTKPSNSTRRDTQWMWILKD